MHPLFSLCGALALLLQAAVQPAAPSKIALEGVGKVAIAIAFVDDARNPMDPVAKKRLEASIARSVGDTLSGAHFQIGSQSDGQVLTMAGGKLAPYFTFRSLTGDSKYDLVIGHGLLPDGTTVNFTLRHSDEPTGAPRHDCAEGYFALPANAQRPAASVYFYEPLNFSAP